MKKEMIRVVLLEAGKFSRVTEIKNSCSTMHQVVGGPTEHIVLNGELVLICNKEGKTKKLKMNRVLTDVNGNVCDVIFGDAFICAGSKNEFRSLSVEQISAVEEKFFSPEIFYGYDDKIKVIKINEGETVEGKIREMSANRTYTRVGNKIIVENSIPDGVEGPEFDPGAVIFTSETQWYGSTTETCPYRHKK